MSADAATAPQTPPSGQAETVRKAEVHDGFWLSAYASLLVVFWTLIIGLFFWFSLTYAYQSARNTAADLVDLVFETDFSLRSQHKTPPSHIFSSAPPLSTQPPPKADRDVDPRAMPHLHALLPVHSMSERGKGIQGRIISPHISGPGRPDAWEAGSIARMESSGKGEVREVANLNKEPHLRVLRPLPKGQNCTSCHADAPAATANGVVPQGFISLAAPMDPLWEKARGDVRIFALGHGLLWLLGVLIFVAVGRSMHRRVKERDKAAQALRKLTEELETRVAQRTQDVLKHQRELQAFMDNTDAGVYLKNTRHEFVLVNKRFRSLFNLHSSDELIGRDDHGFAPPEVSAQVEQCEKTVMETRTGAELEVALSMWSDNSIRTFSTVLFPILNADDALEGIGGLVMDVSQRKQMEAALRDAKENAEAASRAKSDFLANISHEIRTPLNGVIGMADLLLRSKLTTDQASMAATIKTAGDSLLAVLNDILDFSKIESGKIQLERLPFSLRDTVFNAVKGLAPIAYQKGLELIIHVSPQVPDYLIGDFTRIRQILLNLVSNAIKFTAHGEVTVRVSHLHSAAEDTALRISVSDSGIGIPEHQQEHIFEAFEQADTSTTRKYGGTGLGLAISSRLAGLMGAQLKLESTYGKGSTFWFDLTLPRVSEQGSPKPVVSVQALSGKRVLIVDDNATNRIILTEQVTAWGMTPRQCPDVDSAMDLLTAAKDGAVPFDIVLSDLQMPGKDGTALGREIQASPALRGMPVVLLSSGGSIQGEDTAALFKTTLTKPVRPEELLRAVSFALGMWESVGMQHMQDTPPESAEPSRPSCLRILLAEDMEMNQMVATRMLTALGHSVHVVDDGQQAILALQSGSFDLILMDIQMPVLDGLQATRQIREAESASSPPRHIPIIAMTAHAMKGDKEKYLQMGMDGYVSKPILSENLAEVIAEVADTFGLAGSAEAPCPPLQEQTPAKAASPSGAAGKDQSPPHSDAGLTRFPSSAYTPATLDVDIMRQSFGEDGEFASKSIGMFLRDAPRLSQDILAAIRHGDNAGLTAGAHALKGLTRYFTRAELFESCLILENLGRDNVLPAKTAQVLHLWAAMETRLKEMGQSMQEHLAHHEADAV